MAFDKLELAKELGVYRDGWRFIDYLLDAAPKEKWVCTIISGEKGSGKSNTLLQHGYSVFHGYDARDDEGRGIIEDWNDMDAWKTTLHYICYRPNHFGKLIDESLKEGTARSWIGWDDIGIHLSTILYSTDRRKWETFATNWVGFRGLLSIFECTAPNKGDVINFIRKDMNYHVELSERQNIDIYRWFKRGNWDDPMKDFNMRIDIELKNRVALDRIPSEVWAEYSNNTKAIREESAQKFRDNMFDLDKPKEEKQVSVRATLVPCSKCGATMNQWNLSTHEPTCNGRGTIRRKREQLVPAPPLST